jgi:hypothetical protein
LHWKTSEEVLNVHQLCKQTLPPRSFPERWPSSLEELAGSAWPRQKNSSRGLHCPESLATAFGSSFVNGIELFLDGGMAQI